MLNLSLLLDGWDNGLINVAREIVGIDGVGVSVNDLIIMVAAKTAVSVGVLNITESIREVVTVEVVVGKVHLLMVVESWVKLISVVHVAFRCLTDGRSHCSEWRRSNLLISLMSLLTETNLVGEVRSLGGNCSFSSSARDSRAVGVT